ncbi:MAG TPA: ribonuclease domain-containing protein [Roseiflexaceae bacterium]|nr:ribonuclease domain-containing protein [Roseiflexaceae bacterium]
MRRSARPGAKPVNANRVTGAIVGLIILGVIAGVLFSLAEGPAGETNRSAATAVAAQLAATPLPGSSAEDGLPIVAVARLPVEAQQTIALILAGGPFPYDRDGDVFRNREGLLPGRPSGYYHEYTVVTPGSDDRGARRIVAGSQGELYYTDDHYASFVRVQQ